MRTTKLELSQINTRLAADNADLRALLSLAQADIARLQAQHTAVTEVASAVNVMRTPTPAPAPRAPRAAYVMTPEQQARAEAMAAAKAFAMKTGRSVLVAA